MSYLLETQNLRIQYGQIVALNELSFAVAPGETVALVGANGAGKTTLMKAIIGLLRPSAGRIVYDGQRFDLTRAHLRARAGIGYSPEGRRIFPGLTVRENLEVASFSSRRETDRLVENMFSLFPDLRTKAASLGWTLSGGQQQMLAVARALMSKPRLLLLDEPSLGLSPKLTDQVLGRIPEISRIGTAVILAEQNLAKALEVTSRAYVLRLGSIVREGASPELRADPMIRNNFLGGL